MKTPTLLRKYIRRGNDRGIAFIYVALLLFALIALVSIAIDIGYMYLSKTQLQNAADSAALAGASKLNVTDTYVFNSYTSAISEAIKFASTNKAANKSVTISSSLNDSVSSNVFNDANPGNDITFGNWILNRNPDPYIEANPSSGGTPVNAIRVKARRTTNSPGGQVAIFFGKLFGREEMSVSATATAIPLGFNSVGLALCTEACNINIPNGTTYFLDLKAKEAKEGEPPPPNGIAWTAIASNQAPDLSPNGDVADLIWNRTKDPLPINFCDPPLCVTTNNGTGGAPSSEGIIGQLNQAFRDPIFDKDHKDYDPNDPTKVIRWYTLAVVLDNASECLHTPGTGCPPGVQGNKTERYHIKRLALIGIVDVTKGGSQGVVIDSLQCLGCNNPPFRLPNQRAKLVRGKQTEQ
jgi:hypothetical protein